MLDRLLAHMSELRPDVAWAVAAHPSVRLSADRQPNFVRLDVGTIDAAPFGVLNWYERGLPAAVATHRPDVVFSVTNYLPLRRLSVPTVLLVQHAGHFSRDFDALYRRHVRRPARVAAWRLKTRWVKHSVRRATAVTVQTGALADAIAATAVRARQSIHVIAHGPGAVDMARSCARTGPAARPIRIGYVAKWGVQKNFDVLFSAAARLVNAGRKLCIVLTLADTLPENAATLRRAEAAGLGGMIENAGEVGSGSISALYDSFDIFVFPSLVESFGFPLVEAMARGLPVVAADTPGNRELAGEAALYFPPRDAASLADLLGEIIDDSGLRAEKSAAASRRAQAFSWEGAAEQTLALLDKAWNSTG